MLNAVRSDLTFLRGMEQAAGREGLMALAEKLAREVDGALPLADSLDTTRYVRELRAVLVALGRPPGGDDDDDWLRSLSTPVGDAEDA